MLRYTLFILALILATTAASAQSPDSLLALAAARGRSGDVGGAIDALRNYLDLPFAESRARLLTRPELLPLHGNDRFMALMTDTRDAYARRYAEIMAADTASGSRPFIDVESAVQTYARVRDMQSGQAFNEQLKAADAIVLPNVRRYRNELFALMKRDTNTYLRLTIGAMLVSLRDSGLTREVADVIRNDDFRRFPKQLFRLSHAIASVDASAALPLLRQMLSVTEGSMFLPQHFMQLSWPTLLFQAWGVAEPDVINELYSHASSADSVVSMNAITVLTAMFDPRAVDVMIARLRATKDPFARAPFIGRLAMLALPETLQQIEALRAETRDSAAAAELAGVAHAIERGGARLKETTGDTLPLSDASRALILENLVASYGMDVSFLGDDVWNAFEFEDIPALQRARAAVLNRISDEAFDDWSRLTRTIIRLRWLNAQ
jgi:hypothetical protein